MFRRRMDPEIRFRVLRILDKVDSLLELPMILSNLDKMRGSKGGSPLADLAEGIGRGFASGRTPDSGDSSLSGDGRQTGL